MYGFTGAMVAGSGGRPGAGPGPNCSEPGCESGEPVDLGTGLFTVEKTDLSVPGVMPIALTRTYRQADNMSRAFGVGATHPYNIFMVGDTFPYTFLDLILRDHSSLSNCSRGIHKPACSLV
jgi:Domain of unknown function (DUF6531)